MPKGEIGMLPPEISKVVDPDIGIDKKPVDPLYLHRSSIIAWALELPANVRRSRRHH